MAMSPLSGPAAARGRRCTGSGCCGRPGTTDPGAGRPTTAGDLSGRRVGWRCRRSQVRLRRADVDVRVAVVAEDPERPIQVQVDRRRLEIFRGVGSDGDVAALRSGCGARTSMYG